MLEQRRRGFYLSVVAILLISVATGTFIFHSLSQIGKDLTDEFHEMYYHAQKLELDTARFRLIVEQFKNDPSDETYQRLMDSLDLIFLRVGVVIDSSMNFSDGTQEFSTALEPALEKIESLLVGGRQQAHDALDEVQEETTAFIRLSQDASRLFNVYVEGSIEGANEKIRLKQVQVIVILGFMMLLLIALVVLVYRQVSIAVDLKKSEENLRRIVDLIPHMIYVRDENGIVELANVEAARDVGRTVEELIGNSFLDHQPIRSIAEETLADDRRVIEGGRPLINFQDVIEDEDGNKRWFAISKIPFTRREDSRQLVLSIKMEITSEKQAELMVRTSEERLQLALEGADLGMWDWNLVSGRCHYSDRYFTMLGYELGELDPSINLWEELVHPEDREPASLVLKEHLNYNGGNWSIEYRLRHKNGSYRWINSHGKVVESDESGKPVRAAGTHLDITESVEAELERRGLEAQLAQSRKMEAIGTLAGGIAHDFNNILTAILGFSELSRNDLKEGSRSRENLEKVLNAGNRAKDLVKNILAFSRKSTQQRVPVQMGQIMEDVLELMRASLPSTVEIDLEVDKNCGQVNADQTQLHQVLMNLCTNSAQAMADEGGLLRLSVDSRQLLEKDVQLEPEVKPGTFVHIAVTDNGPGIDAAILDRIFDPYFTTKEVGKGSGMGLAIVKGIVRSHDGFVQVESIEGKGTTFHLYFPEIHQTVISDDEGYITPQKGRESLMIVDDEEMIVEMSKLLFTQLGYKVYATISPVEAIEKFTTEPDSFDLIITDQTMPRITGEQFARKVLSIRPQMPVILCTGYSEKMDEDHCRRLGITKLVSKPVDTAYLSYLVRQVLDNKNDESSQPQSPML